MITNFSWVLPGRLAGFGIIEGATLAEMTALRAEGVGALVSLTEEPLDSTLALGAGLRYQHLPIPDMQAPSLDEIHCFTRFVDGARGSGLATAVHCRAGLGRTGTMLACYLIHEGHSWAHALAILRLSRPGSVETLSQERAVHEYARTLDGHRQGG